METRVKTDAYDARYTPGRRGRREEREEREEKKVGKERGGREEGRVEKVGRIRIGIVEQLSFHICHAHLLVFWNTF